MIQFVAKIISLAWTKLLKPTQVAVQCNWNLKCWISTSVSSHASAMSCMVAKKVIKLILKFCNEFWDNSRNLISAQEDFTPQGLLKVRGSCSPLANALDFKIQDSWCVFQRPGSWNQGIFFVRLPLFIYISVSCKEKVEIQKLINMKGPKMQIWAILDLFHDLTTVRICAWPDTSFWMLRCWLCLKSYRKFHPMLYFNQMRGSYDGFKKGILIIHGCRCCSTQLVFFTQIFKFIFSYTQQLHPAFFSHHVSLTCVRKLLPDQPKHALPVSWSKVWFRNWALKLSGQQKLEALQDGRRKGRLPIPGREHICYMASLLP